MPGRTKALLQTPQKLLSQPRLGVKLLRRLPRTLRGFNYAHGWKPATGEHGPPPSESEAQRRSANPLKAYFDSRETGPGIWKWTHYFDIYHRHFSKFVGREVHVLEIGIYSGGSLEMWRHYFGPGCRIYGVDIQEACRAYENEYTRIFVGDQEDPEFWRVFREQVPSIDVLIDDGGHQTGQQIVTLEEMLPHIRAGGVYLCEDVQRVHNGFAAYMQGLVNNLNDRRGGHGLTGVSPSEFQTWIHSIHFYPYVTVIEKTDRPVLQFMAQKRGSEWQPLP